MKRRLFIFLLTCILVLSLFSGCRLGGTADPVRTYVQGTLDALYKGEYSDELLLLIDAEDFDQLQALHSAGIEAEVRYFAERFGLGELSRESEEVIASLYEEVYRAMQYAVSASAEQEGFHSVDVTVKPLEVFSRLSQQDLHELAAGQREQAAEGNSFEQRQFEYAETLVSFIRTELEKPVYGEPVSLQILIETDPKSGRLRIVQEGWAVLAGHLLRY